MLDDAARKGGGGCKQPFYLEQAEARSRAEQLLLFLPQVPSDKGRCSGHIQPSYHVPVDRQHRHTQSLLVAHHARFLTRSAAAGVVTSHSTTSFWMGRMRICSPYLMLITPSSSQEVLLQGS